MSIPLHAAQEVGNLKGDLGGENEVSRVTVIADDGVREVFSVTFVATASMAQGDFLLLENGDGQIWAIWADIDAAGTEPNGALYTGADVKVEVDVVTGDTAAQVATKFVDAIEGAVGYDGLVITGSTGVRVFTYDLMGAKDDAETHNEAETTAGSIVAAVTTEGADSTLNSTYVTFRSGGNSAFYAWLNVNGEGVDPAPGGTGIDVAIAASDAIAVVGAALATAVAANANFDADYEGDGVVNLSADALGATTDVGSGDSPFTVSNAVQGSAQKQSPSMSPADISNNPSAF